MSHPHHYMLEEYKIVLDRLVPLAPQELRDEARVIYERLAQDERATERQIQQALIEIGKKEYPYRKAYEALCAKDEEKRFEQAVFARLNEEFLTKVKQVTDHGVHISEYVKSKIFDALPSDERYALEQAVLEAHDAVNKQCDERAQERQQSFEELVAMWTKKRDEVQRLIEELKQMSSRNAELAEEILQTAQVFEEGWSIVSRDPEEKDVREALASYATQLEEHSDDDLLSL